VWAQKKCEGWTTVVKRPEDNGPRPSHRCFFGEYDVIVIIVTKREEPYDNSRTRTYNQGPTMLKYCAPIVAPIVALRLIDCKSVICRRHVH
jgi:hypothetical protein